tara:strand:- start:869 stop:1147 length:279 start_codon:yes stop_codon:yes gene_type:complete
MNELDRLKRDEHAHNELRPLTYALYSTPHLFGKRTFLEFVQGVGSARLKAHVWTLENGSGLDGTKAEFCLVEDWCTHRHGPMRRKLQAGRAR